jgi:hypothetical protein
MQKKIAVALALVFYSTISYAQAPPSGYLLPPKVIVDMLDALGQRVDQAAHDRNAAAAVEWKAP